MIRALEHDRGHKRSTVALWTVAILIEDKANGSAVIQMLSHEIPRILSVNLGLGKVAPKRSAPEAGNIYLPRPD